MASEDYEKEAEKEPFAKQSKKENPEKVSTELVIY